MMSKLVALLVLLFLILPIVTLVLIVEQEPMLRRQTEITPEQIARGKQVFEQNDPRRLKSGSIARATLEQKDLDLALNYFVNHYVGGVAKLKINHAQAIIESTLKLPENPLGRFLNLRLVFKQTETLPEVDHLKLGKLTIPGFLANILVTKKHSLLLPDADWQALYDMIRTVKFYRNRMTVTYKWQNNLPAKISDFLISAHDQQRIETYQQHLAELTHAAKSSLELSELTRPLFRLARERSRQGDAIEENRAAILVLTLYANQLTLNKIIPSFKSRFRPLSRTVKLNNRSDLTKHYLVSATLAAYAGTPLADAVGLYKEMEDSKGGSGFSFNDLAADRAGTEMGERAVRNEAQAKAVQMLMSTASESDFMPKTDDLPEFISKAEFDRRFGGLEGEPYQKMIEEIERRIAVLPINQL